MRKRRERNLPNYSQSLCHLVLGWLLSLSPPSSWPQKHVVLGSASLLLYRHCFLFIPNMLLQCATRTQNFRNGQVLSPRWEAGDQEGEWAHPRPYILLTPIPWYRDRGVSSKFSHPTTDSSSRPSGWGHALYLTFMGLWSQDSLLWSGNIAEAQPLGSQQS